MTRRPLPCRAKLISLEAQMDLQLREYRSVKRVISHEEPQIQRIRKEMEDLRLQEPDGYGLLRDTSLSSLKEYERKLQRMYNKKMQIEKTFQEAGEMIRLEKARAPRFGPLSDFFLLPGEGAGCYFFFIPPPLSC